MAHYLDIERQTRDRDAGVYDAQVIAEYQQELEWQTTWGRLRDGFDASMPILDAGCGTGRFSERLAQLGARVVGCDFSFESLRVARQRTDAAATFVGADVRQLPFRSSVFHQGICSQVIQQLIDRQDAIALLQELSRVLRPGGHLVITVFNYWLAKRVKDWLWLREPGRRWSANGTRLIIGPSCAHVFFTKAEFRDLLCTVFSPQEIVGIWGIVNFERKPLALGRILPRHLWRLCMRADSCIEHTPIARWLGHLWLAKIVKRKS